ncbi:hypothetical protein [Prescottella equi]|nr:hypothetical protein [Prescottella equi]
MRDAKNWSTMMHTFSFETFTGESHQRLASRTKPPSPALLSSPDPAQQQLEASVFRSLADIRERSAHPLHVKRIRLSEDHVPIVFLDGAVEDNDISVRILETCFPFELRSGGLAWECIGTRIDGVDGRDLHLAHVESTARLILRGSAGTDWNAVRKLISRRWEGHSTPLWNHKELTAVEREHASEFSSTQSRRDPRTAMESNLLRRIGIFAEFTSAHLTYAYSSGPDTLRFWLEVDPSVPNRHEQLIAALTDPEWGLGMDVDFEDCLCDDDGGSCYFGLTTPTGDATLTLNFAYHKPRLTRTYFETIGAPRRWINRTFPAAPRSSGGLTWRAPCSDARRV